MKLDSHRVFAPAVPARVCPRGQDPVAPEISEHDQVDEDSDVLGRHEQHRLPVGHSSTSEHRQSGVVEVADD